MEKKIRVLSMGVMAMALLFSLNVSSGQQVADTEIKVLGGRDERKKEERVVEIALGGDVMLGRTVMGKSMDVGDYRYPFLLIGERLRAADLTVVNLENPLVEDCPRVSDGYKFCGVPQMVESLLFAGVDVVSLANNHSNNYGQSGLIETIEALNSNTIGSVGQGRVYKRQIDAQIYGVIGFDVVSAEPTDDDWLLVSKIASEVDILIVEVHWGWEYQAESNSNQKEWGRKMVDLGADIVVGHHPHWVQEIEEYKGGVIYYSLGNLVFDQMWSEQTREGMVAFLYFRDGELVNREERQIYMQQWAQPEWQ